MHMESHLWYVVSGRHRLTLIIMYKEELMNVIMISPIILDWCSASVCPLCSSICCCYHGCSYRVIVLCCYSCRRCVRPLPKKLHVPLSFLRSFSSSCICQLLADPTYVAAPALSSPTGREDLKKLLAGRFTLTTLSIY